ncbi:MAG: hypothetical protein GF320_03895 [Armatimonadia bacterium]|nr:hypothetical protein [Armatimonadia bacterium]
MRSLVCLAVLAVPVCFSASAEPLVVELDELPPGAAMDAPWRTNTFGWRIDQGAIVARGASGSLFHEDAGYGEVISVSALITPLGEEAADWLVCGVTIGSDHGNAWRLNLVRAPQAEEYRRTTELHMALDGQWLAEGMEGSRCEHLESWVREGWTWEFGETYRMALTLDGREGRVMGIIEDADGDPLARHAFGLGENVVRSGWAGIASGNLPIRVDELVIDVVETAQPPVEARAEPRPYVAISPAAEPAFEATGFFRTERADGRWWVADPEGRPVFLVGTDHCNFNVHWCDDLGYAPYSRNMEEKYGGPGPWAGSATERLRGWNFNLLAANHSPETRGHGLAYTGFVSFGSTFARTAWIAEPIHWTGFPDVFHPDWEPFCRFLARQYTAEFLGDPWLLGYFLDNELEWYGKGGYLVDDVFMLPADAPAKRALVEHLQAKHGGIGAANEALGTDFADFDALAAHREPPAPSPALGEVRDEFLSIIAERYFAGACQALEAADPDHMVIGSRFAGRVPEPVLEAAARHLDIFTINTYPRVDMEGDVVQETPEMLLGLYETMGLPMMITEWSFPALDSGLPCEHGAGMRVDTQEQKAECYRIFAETMARMPFMVGYDYFMWVDEPELGISPNFPEDSNYGLVDVNDEPYEVLTEMATEVNARAQSIHAASDPGWQPAEPAAAAIVEGPSPEDLGVRGESVERFEWDLGALTVAHEPGSFALSSIRADDLPLGTLQPLIHQSTPSGERWQGPTETESVTVWESGDVHLADLVLAFPGAESVGRGYRIGYRLAARSGSPVVAAKVLWVENTDDQPLEVRETFHYLLPEIGGSRRGDEVGGPGVPNYYLPSACWHDPEAGGWIGAASVHSSDFLMNLWIGEEGTEHEPGSYHADIRREAGITLAPGERWEEPQPWIGVYGFGPDEPGGWRAVSQSDAQWKEWLASF